MRARDMVGVGVVLAMITVQSVLAGDIQVQVGDVKDSRTTGQFFANLEIELKLMGDDLDGAKGLRCNVTTAIDDTGRNLVNKNDDDHDFSEVDSDNPNNTKVTLQLKNPSRKASTVKELTGEIEIFKPAGDPASVVTVSNLVSKSNTTVSHPSLAAAQIQITVMAKEQADKPSNAGENAFGGMFGGMMGGSENGVTLQVKDSLSKLIEVEFVDASGKVIDQQSTMTMNETRTYDFSEPLPKDAQIRLYVATPKSMIKVPLALQNIPLP